VLVAGLHAMTVQHRLLEPSTPREDSVLHRAGFLRVGVRKGSGCLLHVKVVRAGNPRTERFREQKSLAFFSSN